MVDTQLKTPFTHKLLSGSMVALTLITLLGVGGAGYLYHQKDQKDIKRDRLMEVVVSNLKVINRTAVIAEIISEEVGDSLTIDQQSTMAKVIDMDSLRVGVDPAIVMAIIKQESNWNWKAYNAGSTATGFMQVTFETAEGLFREARVPFSREALQDPIRNVSMGIQVLADKHSATVRGGMSTNEDWTRALWNYSGKGDSYTRDVLAKSVAYRKKLDAPLQLLDKSLKSVTTKEPIRD